MWKIIIIGIFLVTNINFCFANPTTTNNMLEEFNCLYYKVDDGLEYYTFKSNSQNIRVNIKKIKKNNPEAQADQEKQCLGFTMSLSEGLASRLEREGTASPRTRSGGLWR